MRAPLVTAVGTTSFDAICAHDAGAVWPSVWAAATASCSVVLAATLVNAASLTLGFSSSGSVTLSMWKLPSAACLACEAQNAAAPEITGQPWVASHIVLPVTR